MIDKYLQVIEHHKWIVVSLVIGLIALEGWHKWVAHADLVDHEQASVAAAKVDADRQSATVAAGQVQQLQAQVNQLAVANNQLRGEILNAIANRQSQTNQRKQTEQTAPLVDVAGRWATLAKVADGDVRPDTTGGIAVTDRGARQTVQGLEDGQTAIADYADLQRLDAGKDAQIEGLNKLVESETAAAKATQVLLADQIASCKADLKISKDDGAKRGRRGFWKGLATGAGVVAAIAIRFI